MNGRYRADFMRAADGVFRYFGKPSVGNFAFFDKPAHYACHFLHRNGRVLAVLVVKVDMVGLQAFQRTFNGFADVFGARIGNNRFVYVGVISVEGNAKLGGKYNFIAVRL